MQVSVDGAELFYTTRGRGPTCLVLSAIGTAPYERMLARAMENDWALVVVDLRGGGLSTGDGADLTFDALADDLDAVRSSLGVDRAAVFGHSILAMLAIEYARRRPEAVSHVITAGAPPHGDVRAIGAEGARLFELEASADRKTLLRENLSNLPPDATLGQHLFARTPMRFFDPRADARGLYAGSLARPALLTQILGTLAVGWSVLSDPGSLRSPLFLAQGRFDYVVPPSVWEGVPERLPNATFRLFERSGHHPFAEEPDRFRDEVVSWARRGGLTA